MARKGWDALSSSYRNRLVRQGVNRTRYESGAPLYKARGHVSKPREAFNKRTTRFVERFAPPGDSPDIFLEQLRDMGQVKGQEYMDYRRTMTRLYESGRYKEAEVMYKNRDMSIKGPDNMWWYHGMFGG